MNKHKLYEIRWLDHFTHDGHVEVDGFADKVEFTTTGYFVKENKQYYYLAQSVMDDMSYINVMAIFKKGVLSIKEVT